MIAGESPIQLAGDQRTQIFDVRKSPYELSNVLLGVEFAISHDAFVSKTNIRRDIHMRVKRI